MLTVSVIFWFTGLIPDFGDDARQAADHRRAAKSSAMLAMGWRGSAKHWARYQKAYLLLAGSVDAAGGFGPLRGQLRLFASAIVPGWHTTIFPPYFVAGAIYSGFAMVLTLAIPVRRWYHLEDLITMRHIECMAKVMLGTGLIVAYGYAMEAFMAWYSVNQYERYAFFNRAFPQHGTHALPQQGTYWWTYWLLITCNILIPQAAVVETHPAARLERFSDRAGGQRRACGWSAS